jgi:hypothetical protein
MSASDRPARAAATSGGDQISSVEANHWWRNTAPAGALLNRLMLLFIVAPVVLVLKSLYTLSFLVFVLMIPYGLFVRRLAVRAVRRHLQKHPEERERFEQMGIISAESQP